MIEKILFFAAVLLVSAAFAPRLSWAKGSLDNVSAHGFYEQIMDDPEGVVLDIRTPGEFAQGHVAGAVNVDFYDSGFASELQKMPKDKTYFVYCRSGNRSSKALSMMKAMGFTSIVHMDRGIIDWIRSGFPLD
ncbi:MAG: rhodanese-like domain-containing protein [Desulfovibrio sp.]